MTTQEPERHANDERLMGEAPRWHAPERSRAGAALRPVLLLLLLLLLGAVTLWLAGAPRAAAQQRDLAPFAQAYNAAWNARDLDAVLAFFAPDAIVLDTVADSDKPPASWVGEDAIRARMRTAFLAQSHVDTSTYQTSAQRSGETVTWRYRLWENPYQQWPGVEPVDGTAEAVVQAGQIIRLRTAHDSDSVHRRSDALFAAARSRVPQLGAPAAPGLAPAQDASRPQPRQTRDGAEPTRPAWPLALGSLALLGALTRVLRRRGSRG